jgi:hypothetical protein
MEQISGLSIRVLGILECHLLRAAFLRSHHNSSCELIMPALPPVIKRSPDKAKTQGHAGQIVTKVVADEVVCLCARRSIHICLFVIYGPG